MSDINKKGIWNTSIFHELYGMNFTEYYSTTTQTDSYTFTPTTANNSTFNFYRLLYSNFELGDKIRIIMKVQYNGFDTTNTNGDFLIYFQGARINSAGTGVWTGKNALVDSLNSYQNLTNLVLSQTQGEFIYNTTFVVSENDYNNYIGCNIAIRSNYSNGTGNITVYKPIIFLDKYYYLETDSIIRQGDDFLSCKEIVEY